LVDPRDIYGDVPRGLERVVLFGDDMSGYCAGFDIATWKVVEVDPTNMVAEPVAESFEAFIRNRF
jgi:hypothetical protein